MEVSTSLVGARLRPYETTIDWQRMMNYAAAVDDPNPAYFDDLRPEGVIGHPMLAVAVTWPIMEHLDEHLVADAFDPQVLATQVHYGEHLRFHRPLVDGDRLKVEGEVAAVLPHRAGTRIVLRFDAVDAAGRPVFTEHIGGLLRGVGCAGRPAGAEALPASPEPGPDAGPSWARSLEIDALRAHVYDGCTGIHFPIHTSRRFAQWVGLPGIILQGTATLAFAVRELVDREAGGDPARLESVSCRFGAMVPPGSRIEVRLVGRAPAPGGLFFDVLNHEGRPAIRDGYAVLRGGRKGSEA